MNNLPATYSSRIAIIGLGYVGLPLAAEFAKSRTTPSTVPYPDIIAFDIDASRIEQLQASYDRTGEVPRHYLESCKNILFTSNPDVLSTADIFIVAVPTPIDSAKQPDLSALISATKTVGMALHIRSKGQFNISTPVVIYESTVYPGATNELCIPILEEISGLRYNSTDSPLLNTFLCAYSPERINPGDTVNNLRSIVKVVGADSKMCSNFVASLYELVVSAGVHVVSNIKAAEAAKIIENTQRDINIALINEFAIILSYLDISTSEVLEAAKTKWNFIPFMPGLVGGHCIGVDPYYLTYKAQLVGYHPEVVLAGRRINDTMATWIAVRIIKELCKTSVNPGEANILILGFTFKENCNDTRNTKCLDLYNEFVSYGATVTITDPLANKDLVMSEYGIEIVNDIPVGSAYNVIVLAVPHLQFLQFTESYWRSFLLPGAIIFDVKSALPSSLNALTL
jgi:UDP-N-acetyl-D-galactosamine dehydrogenase